MTRQHPVRRYRPRRCRAAAQRTPLESARWLEARYRAIVAAEEAKGPGADAARVDAALKAIAGLVRAAAPYRHPRIKPVEPPKPPRQIIEVRWAGEPERFPRPARNQGS
jgi:hypothetical protein